MNLIILLYFVIILVIGLVGNNSHLFDQIQVSESVARIYAQEIGAIFRLISSCTGEGINELFRSIGCKILDPNYKEHEDSGNKINNKKYLKLGNEVERIETCKTKENINTNELQKQLNNLKLENKNLANQLKEEKDKNKKLEEKIKELQIELYNESIKNIDKELNKGLNNDIEQKDLYKSNFEKDKEIKELKKKLSRFPFELEEGEKLMVVHFTSVDQKLNHSIICKNTDIFNTIENKLYKDNEEYYDTPNYFTVNGTKIHKNKSLEWNKIKNNDNIILNIFDI